MIISELCPNGDLFDFIRNTPPLELRGVVSCFAYVPSHLLDSPLFATVEHDERHRSRYRVLAPTEASYHPP